MNGFRADFEADGINESAQGTAFSDVVTGNERKTCKTPPFKVYVQRGDDRVFFQGSPEGLQVLNRRGQSAGSPAFEVFFADAHPDVISGLHFNAVAVAAQHFQFGDGVVRFKKPDGFKVGSTLHKERQNGVGGGIRRAAFFVVEVNHDEVSVVFRITFMVNGRGDKGGLILGTHDAVCFTAAPKQNVAASLGVAEVSKSLFRKPAVDLGVVMTEGQGEPRQVPGG